MRRHVVITGANRGLGLELARQCAARGDKVVGACRRPADAKELRACDGVVVLPLDVTDEVSIGDFAEALRQQMDPVDLLVHNAGVNGTAFGAASDHRGVLELPASNVLDQMRVNAIGPMLLTRALVPALQHARRGVVVNISSQLGSLARGKDMPGDIGYNASKAALNMMTRALAAALEPDGITVVSLHPGWIRTDMGGAEAPLTAEASARACLATVEGLTREDSGAFLQWDGTSHPW